MKSIGLLLGTTVGLMGCATGARDEAVSYEEEALATVQSAISELNCAFRPISAPASGATFTNLPYPWGGGSSAYAMSPNTTYGYTNCKQAYIVDYLSITDNPPSGNTVGGNFTSLGPGVLGATVKAITDTSTQHYCEDTEIRVYVYGTDADGVTWNQETDPSSSAALPKVVRGRWVDYPPSPTPTFSYDHCTFSSNDNDYSNAIALPIDRYHFSSDPGIPPIESIRVVAQVRSYSLGYGLQVEVGLDRGYSYQIK